MKNKRVLRPYVVPTLDHRLRPVKIRPVQSGDIYRFAMDVSTRAGHTHPAGSLLHVHDPTTRSPHGEISESGRNWICRTDFGISCWATLEQCIGRGLLEKVDQVLESG